MDVTLDAAAAAEDGVAITPVPAGDRERAALEAASTDWAAVAPVKIHPLFRKRKRADDDDTGASAAAATAEDGGADDEAKVSFTDEQERVLACDPPEGGTIAITAFAGTGKTSTILEYARRRPERRFLVLVFNREMAANIKTRITGLANVECQTFDSRVHATLRASHEIGPRHFETADLMQHLPLGSSAAVANAVIGCLRRFCDSGATEFGDKFHPLAFPGGVTRAAVRALQPHVLAALMDPTKGLPISYNMARKIVHLSGTRIDGGADYIVVDEAQDMNPVMLAVLLQQTTARKIVCGDPHQSIYSFMGSNDALSRFPHATPFHLTHSFRFGRTIAETLNGLLQKLKRETIPIVGRARRDGVVVYPPYSGAPAGRICTLCRANLSVFQRAHELARSGQAYHVLGGADKWRKLMADVREMLAAYDRDPAAFRLKLARCTSGADDGNEAKSQAQFLMKHIARDPAAIRDQVQYLEKHPPARTEGDGVAVVGTVHQSKGREFRIVMLADDFKLQRGRGSKESSEEYATRIYEEYNILYVAASRAQLVLVANGEVKRVLDSPPPPRPEDAPKPAQAPTAYRRQATAAGAPRARASRR